MLRKKTPIGKLEEQPNVHPAQEKVKVLYIRNMYRFGKCLIKGPSGRTPRRCQP